MGKGEQREKIRKILKYWGNAERARKDKAERIAEVEQEISAQYDVHPQELTGMPHGTGTTDPTAQAALRAAKIIAGLEAARERLKDEIAEIDRRTSLIEYEVMCLPPLESEVIRLRYVRFGVAKKGYWAKIARRVHVSEDHAKTLERNGVDRLGSAFNLESP